jgi:6,7-dimethyl-8-ribityllumazine synthase
MQNADHGLESPSDGEGFRVGIVQARFNAGITDALVASVREALRELGVAPGDIQVVQVPGALEIALALQALAGQDSFDALIAVGCVIRGETYHFELVANESGSGITRVSLDHGLPIANLVLTVDTEAQAWARVEEKGRDAARVAIDMATLLEDLS